MAKKSKFSFGPNGFKGFLMEHVEKIVLGVVLLIVVCFVYFGSTVETFPASDTPAALEGVVQRAHTTLDTKSWDKIKETIAPPSIENPIVINVSESDFPIRSWDERILPSRTKRRDPKIYPPTNIEVTSIVAAVGMIPGEEEIAPIDQAYQEMLERQQVPIEPIDPVPTKKKKKRRGSPGEEDLLGESGRGIGSMNGPKQPRMLDEEEREALGLLGARVSTQAIARSRNIVSLRALLPFQKQLLEYQEALAGNPQYVNEERDIPTYVFFKVERADVTANPEADPKTLQWVLLSTVAARNLPYARGAEWEMIPEELVDPAAVILATERFGALTLPVPPALLTDLKKLSGHAEIDWANALQGEGMLGPEVDPMEDPDSPMAEGPEGPEGPGTVAPGIEGPGRPGQGRPSGPRSVGPGPGPRMQGRGIGRGGFEGGVAGVTDVVYKLFRFIDFDVERGHLYRYRISLMLEDPNHPQLPLVAAGAPSGRDALNTLDPPPASLDKEVEQRLRELKKEEEKTGKRRWYRETDWSEASPIVAVPEPLQFVGGEVTPARETPVAGTNARVATGEASAKTLVVQWDDEFASNVVAEEEVQRGSVMNFVKDAEVLHPIRLEYIELKDYVTKTNALVVDIRGGERLPGSYQNPQAAPGSVAVIDHTGKLVVLNEANDIKAWHRYGKVEPIKIEEPKPEDLPGGEGGYGDLDVQPRRPRRSR